MSKNKSKPRENTYLQVKGEPLKVEIVTYQFQFGNNNSSLYSGSASGAVKLSAVYVFPSEQGSKLLTHLVAKNLSDPPPEAKFEQVSIIKNSKKLCDFFDCYVNIWNLSSNGSALIEAKKFEMFQ